MSKKSIINKYILPCEARSAITMLSTALLLSLVFLWMNRWGPAEKKYVITSDDIWVVETYLNIKSDDDVNFFLNQELSNKKDKKEKTDEGTLFIATERLQAFDLKDGNLLWETPGVKASKNTAYSGFGIISGDNPLEIYSLEDGKKINSIKLPTVPLTVIKAFLPNSVYIFDGKDISLFELTGEKTAWSKKVFDSIPESFPGIAHSYDITAVGSSDEIYFFDSNDGSISGHVKMPLGQKYAFPAGLDDSETAVHTSPAEGKDGLLIYFTANLKDKRPPVFREIFRKTVLPPAASPAINKTGIYTASIDKDGRILLSAYSLTKGDKMWEMPLQGEIPQGRRLSVSADEALLKVIHPSRGLLIFNPKNGKLMLEKNLNRHIAKKGGKNKKPSYFGIEKDRTLILYDQGSNLLADIRIITNQDVLE